jgi:hypothetical protein
VNELEAGRFTKQREQRQLFKQFHEAMRLIVFCYKKVLNTESFDLLEIHKKKRVKPEDYLKYNLTNHLKKNKKFFPGIEHLLFLPETGEYDEDKETESSNDIAIFNTDPGFIRGVDEDLTHEDYYFSFECKRLKNLGKNRLYIQQGIKRYVENSYARAMPFAGMIGFVEAGDITAIKNDINCRLGGWDEKGELTTMELLRFFKIEEDFEYSYSSKHERVKNTCIRLYHIFLDYTPVIL